MNTPAEWLDVMLQDIQKAKEQGKNKVYWFNYKIDNQAVDYIVRHFSGNPNYVVETRKCPNCTHTWDIIVLII